MTRSPDRHPETVALGDHGAALARALPPAPAPGAAPSQRGSVLLVSVGILALLSIMAVTFVSLMKLEQTAAVNYMDSQRAKLTAEAGMKRVLTSLRQSLGKPLFEGDSLAPHIFGASGKEIDVTLSADDVNPRNNPFFWGYTGRQYTTGAPIDFSRPETVVGLDEYKVKVIETSALIDLNYPTEIDEDTRRPAEDQIFELMLEALGTALARGPNHFDPISQARFEGPGGTFQGAQAVLALRATLDGDRFTSKAQLRELFPEDTQGDYAFALLSDYVTAHAWRDFKAVRSATEASVVSHHAVRAEEGGRAQVNLNLAPKEVLVACIAPLAGRRYALVPEAQTQQIEEQNLAAYYGMAAGGTANPAPSGYDLKEETAYQVREGYVYIGPIGVERAERVADWIITNRPFRSIAHFHARLLEESEKPTGALDAALPTPSPAEARIIPSAEPRYNLNGIHQKPWFAEWVRKAGYSLLMANFNPSFASNSLNPNQAAFFPIDKASLVYPTDWGRDDPLSTIRSRQTVDGCVDERGIYELTSLGQIRGKEGEIIAREKMRAVVKTFDMEVHRTQSDFETNDFTHRQDRIFIASHPENQTFFKTSNIGTWTDTPDLMVARAWGHLEIDARTHYFDGAPVPVEDLAGAAWGGVVFGAMFDGLQSLQNPGSYLHANVGNGQPLAAQLTPTGFQKARGSAMQKAYTASNWRATAGNGTLFSDGFYSSHRKGRDLSLWYRAGFDDGSSGPGPDPTKNILQGALGEGTGPSLADAQAGNLWYRRGGLEFWYKPDFDWTLKGDPTKPFPISCGYVFGSRVYYNPGQSVVNPDDGYFKAAPLTDSPTDGTQLYVFRNTAGQLRATRLYFRVVGDWRTPEGELPDKFIDQVDGDPYPKGGGTHFTSGGEYVQGGGTGGAIELYKEASERRPFTAATGTQPAAGYRWPPAELKADPGIKRARTDAYVDTSYMAKWRANEWHHIAVAWDDAQDASNQALRIYVDGVLASTSHGLPASTAEPNNNLFVRLNEPPERDVDGDGVKESYPKDQLYVGGIERNLALPSTGIFKQVNTVAQAGGESIIPNQIRLFSNGTIDDFVVWDVSTPADRDRLQNVFQFGRYEPSADYVQHFDLDAKFPGGSSPIQLARLHVSALLPTRHGEHAPAIGGRGAVTVSIEEPVGIKMRHPGTRQVVDELTIDSMVDWAHVELIDASGQPALLVPPADPFSPRPKLRYHLQLQAATFPPGSSGVTPQMNAVDTPVVQEVGVSWFLPVEEVLLQEWVVD